MGVEYFTKCDFSWIYFKVDFFKNLIKRTFCSTNRYLDGKEKPKKKKDNEIIKDKEKIRESEKRSYKKERKRIKIRKEKKR